MHVQKPLDKPYAYIFILKIRGHQDPPYMFLGSRLIFVFQFEAIQGQVSVLVVLNEDK